MGGGGSNSLRVPSSLPPLYLDSGVFMFFECFIFDLILEAIARDVEDHLVLMMFHGVSAPLQVEGGCFRGAGRVGRVMSYILAAWAPPHSEGAEHGGWSSFAVDQPSFERSGFRFPPSDECWRLVRF